jgi:ribosome-associated heat shock protein Hsp15
MRIDKYLWCVRYYKTRMTEACKKNHVTVNGLVAKPSKEVFPTDKVTFRKDQITQIITVLDIPESRVGLNWLICIEMILLQSRSNIWSY